MEWTSHAVRESFPFILPPRWTDSQTLFEQRQHWGDWSSWQSPPHSWPRHLVAKLLQGPHSHRPKPLSGVRF